jgi:hypothetical protein
MEEESPTPALRVKFGKGYDLQGRIKYTKERCVPEVPEPAKHKLTKEEFWECENVPNVKLIREHLKAEGMSLLLSFIVC